MEQNKEDATQAEWSAEFRGKKDRTRARRHFCRFSHGRGLRFSRRRTLRSDPHGPLLRSRFNISSHIHIYMCKGTKGVRESLPSIFFNPFEFSNGCFVSPSLNLFYFIRVWIWIVKSFLLVDFFFELMNTKMKLNFEKKGAPKECYKNGFVELLYFFGRFYRFSRR